MASLSHWVTLSGIPAFNTQGSLPLLNLCIAIPKFIIVSIKQLELFKKSSHNFKAVAIFVTVKLWLVYVYI